MKTEFLKDLGLEQTVIDQIMAENGKDIAKLQSETESQKALLETSQAELEAAKTQLKTANETITGFGDVEAIKGQVTEYKTKYEQSEADYQAKFEAAKGEYEAKLSGMALDSALKDKLSGHKFSSEYAKQGVFNEIKSKGLKLDGDKIIGFDDVFGAIKEAQPTAFAEDKQDATVKVDFSKQANNGSSKSEDTNKIMNDFILNGIKNT